jgi:hypothetical protein
VIGGATAEGGVAEGGDPSGAAYSGTGGEVGASVAGAGTVVVFLGGLDIVEGDRMRVTVNSVADSTATSLGQDYGTTWHSPRLRAHSIIRMKAMHTQRGID